MPVQDIRGEKALDEYTRYDDLPTDRNKAFTFPLGNEGGVSKDQGKYYDPATLSLVEAPDEDHTKVNPSWIQLLLIAAGAAAVIWLIKRA